MANNQAVEEVKPEEKPLDRLKSAIVAESVQAQFQNALAENSGPFVASVIDLFGSDTYLQKCEPAAVIMEALKAATLKLPINKQLGFAYIIPYKNNGKQIPQFQLGYKGYIQLAMRTGQYRYLNAGTVRKGQSVETNTLTGETRFIGEPTGDEATGYFCYMELLNGFTKTVYMSKEEITAHAKKYSKSFSKQNSPWKTEFDEMATKTVVRRLLSKYGILSVEMISALTSDTEDDVQREITNKANGEIIEIEAEAIEAAPDATEAATEPEPETSEANPGY